MGKAKIVLASLVWLIILGIGVSIYRWWYVPTVEKQARQAEEEIVDLTSSSSSYKHHLKIGLDAFSGYAILRSDEMQQQLRGRGIKLEAIDDGADYSQRLADLAAGDLQLAAFPIDALLKASANSGSLPATIVAIIDETRGADAVVAYQRQFPNVDALNRPETRFVLVGDSPSETLVRVLMNNFQLDALTDAAIDRVADADQVLARYRKATPSGHEVFVTWEPVVSELLENEQMHVLLDSSRQSGYIVDTLVVSRDYLVKNKPVVSQFLESYFRTLYSIDTEEKLIELVRRDADKAGASLDQSQAQRLVQGIVWKNTQENLAHFGLRSASVVYLEDMIDRIKRVLTDTGGLTSDPTGGDAGKLFYKDALRELQEAGFHPGVSPESVREDEQVVALSDSQWEKLETVGTVQVPPLYFAPGTATLRGSSRAKLDDLAETLKAWPKYYLMITGTAGSRGDLEANRRLAKQRAEAALQYLLDRGVPADKMRALEGQIGSKMSVNFVLGQLPY